MIDVWKYADTRLIYANQVLAAGRAIQNETIRWKAGDAFAGSPKRCQKKNTLQIDWLNF